MIEKIKLPIIDLELNVTAGHVLLFSVPLIVVAYGFIFLQSKPAHRTAVVEAFWIVPLIALSFLGLQFFLLLAPPGECNSFDRWRYLTDATLRSFKPEYCMSLSPDEQTRIPWLIDPPILQAWGQIVLILGAFVVYGMHLRGNKHIGRRRRA